MVLKYVKSITRVYVVSLLRDEAVEKYIQILRFEIERRRTCCCLDDGRVVVSCLKLVRA